MASITVTTLADAPWQQTMGDGLVSLREAVQVANSNLTIDGATGSPGHDTIVFDPSLSGPVLLDSQLTIEEALTIDGQGPDQTVLDAQQNSRIFLIQGNINTPSVILNKMTLTGGRTTGSGSYSAGGAIKTWGASLIISNCVISDNSTEGHDADGGAIAAFGGGYTFISQSIISGNSTAGVFSSGGAIYAESGDVDIVLSTVEDNSTENDLSPGGAIYGGGDVNIYLNSTISGNFTLGEQSWGGAIARIGRW